MQHSPDDNKVPVEEADNDTLLPPDDVADKYPQLKTISKITTLAVKLLKKSFFGKEVTRKCKVRGTWEQSALPPEKLTELKLC